MARSILRALRKASSRGQTVDAVVVDEPNRLRYWDIRVNRRKSKPEHEKSCGECGYKMAWVVDQFMCPYSDCPVNMGKHSIYAGIHRGRYCTL